MHLGRMTLGLCHTNQNTSLGMQPTREKEKELFGDELATFSDTRSCTSAMPHTYSGHLTNTPLAQIGVQCVPLS